MLKKRSKNNFKDLATRTPLIEINNVDEFDSMIYKENSTDYNEDPLENCEIDDND